MHARKFDQIPCLGLFQQGVNHCGKIISENGIIFQNEPPFVVGELAP